MQKKTSVIYPGTFDPLTNGHQDLITRAASLFDQVIVAVAESTAKDTWFTADERAEFARIALQNLSNVTVKTFGGLLVDFARLENIPVVLRGIRAIADFEYERQLASMNQDLWPHLETVFLAPRAQYAHISSTFVRDVARLGGDVELFVAPHVAKALRKKQAK